MSQTYQIQPFMPRPQLALQTISSASTALLFFPRKLVLNQSFVFYSRISWNGDVDDLGLHCLLIHEVNVRSSSFNHPITLYIEIPQNSKTFVFYHSLLGVCTIGSLKFCLSTQLPKHIQCNVVVAPVILMYQLAAFTCWMFYTFLSVSSFSLFHVSLQCCSLAFFTAITFLIFLFTLWNSFFDCLGCYRSIEFHS